MTRLQFVAAADGGQHEWWRYLIGTIVILFFWLIIGSFFVAIPFVYASIIDPANVDINSAQISSGYPLLEFVSINLSFLMMVFGVAVATRFVHQRPVWTLLTFRRPLRWPRVFIGFGLMLLLVAAAGIVEAVLNPGLYQWQFDFQRWLPFVLATLFLTPLQTSAEELMFRGYFLQGLGRLTQNIWVLTLLNGILFMVPHLANPEIQVNPLLLALGYLASGMFFSYITLHDGGMELALGAHAANNMFAFIFANYVSSALPTPSIYLVTELDPVYSLIAFLVVAVLFSMVLLRRPVAVVAVPTEGVERDNQN